MEIIFPDLPVYHGWSKPMRSESSVRGLELLEGKVPPELVGAWYRGGPDRQFPSVLDEDIFIDGEGMAHLLRFEAGGFVSYQSRWVRTERYIAQEKAGRGLFGRYRNRFTAAPEAEGIHQGAANTNLMFHAGRLTALKEDDLPYELDPNTLETRGKIDMDGQVSSESLTAHYKIDWQTNELFMYSNQAKGDATRDMAIYIFDGQGKKTHEVWFESPWPGLVHDFAITKEHIIVPIFPLITDMETLKKGGTFYEWHDDKPMMVAILPRYGKAEDIRWFRGPTVSAGHMMNAWTEGDQVFLDLCLYSGNCFPFFTTPDGRSTEPVPPILSRITFDMNGGEEAMEIRPIIQQPGEMPRTDDRYQGLPYRHGYMSMGRSPDGSGTIGHINVETGDVQMWQHGQRISMQEPQFVPRSVTAPEADGWILSIINRLDEGHSEIAVLDGQHIADGPIARLYLPVRIRSTFHGYWVPESTLKTGLYPSP